MPESSEQRFELHQIVTAMLLRRASELFARYYVFLFINVYGVGKMMNGQFYRQGNLPPEVAAKSIGDLTGFELAWTFFGFSSWYIYFIGTSQVIGGWLLLFNRTKLIGVAILLPILMNIIMVDYCFKISYGAMWSAIVYFSLCLFILYLNRKQVIAACKILIMPAPLTAPVDFKQRLLPWLLAALFGAVLFYIEINGIRKFGY